MSHERVSIYPITRLNLFIDFFYEKNLPISCQEVENVMNSLCT